MLPVSKSEKKNTGSLDLDSIGELRNTRVVRNTKGIILNSKHRCTSI